MTDNSENFILDPRLEKDCHFLVQLKLSGLLLMNRDQIPWFVLVPRVDRDVREIFDLLPDQQLQLAEEVRALAAHISKRYKIHKLNFGAIGNVVSQLHIHVMGRYSDDPWWPGVVWGQPGGLEIQPARVEEIRKTVLEDLREYLAG